MSVDDERLEVQPDEEAGSWMALGPAAASWSPLTEPGEWVSAAELARGEKTRGELERWESRLTTIETAFEIAVAEQASRLAQAQLGAFSDALNGIVQSYNASVESIIERSIDAILEVAEVVVRREVTETRTSIESHVRRCLTQRSTESLQVRLAPEDWNSIASAPGTKTDVPWVCDLNLKRGDVVIEYEDGRLNCTIDALLESFREELRDHMSSLQGTLGVESSTSACEAKVSEQSGPAKVSEPPTIQDEA